MRRQGPRTRDKTVNFLVRLWEESWTVCSHKGRRPRISKAIVHLAQILEPVKDEVKFVISPAIFKGSPKIAQLHQEAGLKQFCKNRGPLPATVTSTKSQPTGTLKYTVVIQTSDNKSQNITFSGHPLVLAPRKKGANAHPSTHATTPKQRVALFVTNIARLVGDTILILLDMADAAEPKVPTSYSRNYGPPPGPYVPSSSKEQSERPPSRGFISRIRSSSSLAKVYSKEENPSHPERPPSRGFLSRVRSSSSLAKDRSKEHPSPDPSHPERPPSRNMFSRSRSSTAFSKSGTTEEFSQLALSDSRPSSRLSVSRSKSPSVSSPSGAQSTGGNVSDRWLRKDTPIVVEAPKKEFIFNENEALVALTPIERRALRKAPYVKTIVPIYRVPGNTRRNSIDFNHYKDLFTQVYMLSKTRIVSTYANLPFRMMRATRMCFFPSFSPMSRSHAIL